MLLDTSTDIANRLILELPRKESKLLLTACETVQLDFGTILTERGDQIKNIYFPLNSFVSLVTPLKGHPPLEMGIIGNEGAYGASVVLGVTTAPMRAVVQGLGTALRIETKQFQRIARNSPVLLRTMNRYVYVMMAQLAQTGACNHFHEIEPRLARWLLMTNDRAHSNHFHLTHEFLADMLGVRRSGITVAAGALQAKKLIGYTRGEISILDRHGLEAASCECYDAVNEEYARQFS